MFALTRIRIGNLTATWTVWLDPFEVPGKKISRAYLMQHLWVRANGVNPIIFGSCDLLIN
jgi:hypothetical protein